MAPTTPELTLHSTSLDAFSFENPLRCPATSAPDASNELTPAAVATKDKNGEEEDVQEQKLAILGSGNVGKSSLAIRLVSGNFMSYHDPTIEDCFKSEQCIDGRHVYLEIIDTAGAEEYAAMQDQWVNENEAFLLVYSIDDAASFEEVQNLMTKIDVQNHHDRRIREVVLVGNKCDKHDSREVSFEAGQTFAKEWGCIFLETSAKEVVNVSEAFSELVRASWKSKAGPAQPQRQQSDNPCCIIM